MKFNTSHLKPVVKSSNLNMSQLTIHFLLSQHLLQPLPSHSPVLSSLLSSPLLSSLALLSQSLCLTHLHSLFGFILMPLSRGLSSESNIPPSGHACVCPPPWGSSKQTFYIILSQIQKNNHRKSQYLTTVALKHKATFTSPQRSRPRTLTLSTHSTHSSSSHEASSFCHATGHTCLLLSVQDHKQSRS